MMEIKNITEVLNHIAGLKAVIFDLDDTLYGEKEYVKSGYKEVAKLLKCVDNAEKKLWDAFEAKKNAIDYVLEQEGIWSEELKSGCIKAYRGHQPNIHLYCGVKEMLTELKAMGIKIGIITDGRPEGQWAKLKALNLEEFASNIIVTDQLGGIEYRKPNAAAFKLMKEKMNVEFGEMCYVGDNINKDFIAPEALGMRAIWFKNKDGLYYREN